MKNQLIVKGEHGATFEYCGLEFQPYGKIRSRMFNKVTALVEDTGIISKELWSFKDFWNAAKQGNASGDVFFHKGKYYIPAGACLYLLNWEPNEESPDSKNRRKPQNTARKVTSIQYDIQYYFICSCGAVTITIDDMTFSVRKSKLKEHLPGIDLRKYRCKRTSNMSTCNYCINNFGLDLCACGSGKPFTRCRDGYSVCGKPMQVLGEYTSVCASGAFGPPQNHALRL